MIISIKMKSSTPKYDMMGIDSLIFGSPVNNADTNAVTLIAKENDIKWNNSIRRPSDENQVGDMKNKMKSRISIRSKFAIVGS